MVSAALFEDLNVPLHPDDMRLVSQRGGTFLKSSRFPEFREVDVAKKAAQVLDQHDISALVVIGGDGSFRGAHHFKINTGEAKLLVYPEPLTTTWPELT